ncbi:MAG: macro domain-containing protein [Crenarchaeota archaeon]|nr:macro domain-containing protein [Thermoproteota archaeon]
MRIVLRRGNVEIVLEVGDLTEFSGDAIVNPANTRLVMGGGVAGAIRRRGGEEIEREAVSKGPCPIGKAVVTGAGKLKCRYVIHAPTVEEPASPSSPDKVYRATLAALEEAKRHGITSLAFPLMGAGVGGVSVEDSIRSMARAFSERGEGLRIYVIVLNPETLQRAVSALESEGWRRSEQS